MNSKALFQSIKYIKWNTQTRTVTKTTSEEFMAALPEIVRNVTNVTDLPKVITHYDTLFNYNFTAGHQLKGLMTVNAYKSLEMSKKLTAEKELNAKIMGWCIEILELFLVMLEDIIAHSEMRRGKACWYKQMESWADALNDCWFLEQLVFHVLKLNFEKHRNYRPIVELFHSIPFNKSMGNTIYAFPKEINRPNLENFTTNNYQKITKLKHGYLFQMPLLLAMYMAESQDLDDAGHAKALLLDMGVFREIQKDFFDCFGDPTKAERGGADIRQGRCSWLAVKALEKVDVHQRKVMEKHYGLPTTEPAEIIRHLYEELDLPKCYTNLREASFESFRQRIQQMPEGLLQNLFQDLLEHTFKI